MKILSSFFSLFLVLNFSAAFADPVLPPCEDNFFDFQAPEVLSFDASQATYLQSTLQENNEFLIEVFDNQGLLIGSELRPVVTKCRN